MVRLPRFLYRLRADPPDQPAQEAERHASWLELFFDLVFVLALSGITERLGADGAPSAGEILVAAGIYVIVQWSWLGQAFFDARFDIDDVPHRLLILVATAGAGAEALGTRESVDSYLLPIGYLVVRGAAILSYVRVYLSRHPGRGVVPVYLKGFTLGWLLWLASLALPASQRPVLWIAGLAVELLTPWVGSRRLRRYPVNPTHLPERIGQFTIILLGSTLADLSGAVPVSDTSKRVVGAAALAFLVPASIWWVYATFLVSRLAVPRLGSGRAYAILHSPFGAGILFLGWALGRVIDFIGQGATELPFKLRVVLAASLVVWMLAGLGMHWFSRGSVLPRRLVLVIAGSVLLTLVAFLVTDPGLTLILVSAVMVCYAIGVTRQISGRGRLIGEAGGGDTDRG